MARSNEPVTLGEVRKTIFVAGVCFALIIVGLFFKFTLDSVTNQRAACDRGNDSRAAQLEHFDHLITVNQGREEAAEQEGDTAAAAANAVAIKLYRQDRNEFVAAQASIAEEEGSVRADCEAAYPKPWPFH